MNKQGKAEFNYTRKEILAKDIFITHRNYDNKVMQPFSVANSAGLKEYSASRFQQ